MKSKTKYLLLVLIIHLVFLALSISIYKYNKPLFIICETALLFSIIIFIKVYRSIFSPLRQLNAGIESLKDKDFSSRILPVNQPDLDDLITVFNKMNDQLRLERTITTEKNFFLEKLIAASPSAIILLDFDENIKELNPAANKLFKLRSKDPSPTSLSELPKPWNKELLDIEEMHPVVIQSNGINQYKCTKAHFLDRGVRQSFFFIEELTKEILNAERLSYEKIIRMMSHEVNNSVGAVNSILESTIGYISDQHSNFDIDFKQALKVASDRIVNLNIFTKRFTDIVHIPIPHLTTCNLEDTVRNTIIYYSSEINKKEISVKTVFDNGKNTIEFDQQQLELVLINIIKNAVQAINNKEGLLNIFYISEEKKLVIENNGEPMPDKIERRLFEPFFTTKRTGQGVGLTLIREILSNHNCEFYLKTRPDSITEFSITFAESIPKQ